MSRVLDNLNKAGPSSAPAKCEHGYTGGAVYGCHECQQQENDMVEKAGTGGTAPHLTPPPDVKPATQPPQAAIQPGTVVNPIRYTKTEVDGLINAIFKKHGLHPVGPGLDAFWEAQDKVLDRDKADGARLADLSEEWYNALEKPVLPCPVDHLGDYDRYVQDLAVYYTKQLGLSDWAQAELAMLLFTRMYRDGFAAAKEVV